MDNIFMIVGLCIGRLDYESKFAFIVPVIRCQYQSVADVKFVFYYLSCMYLNLVFAILFAFVKRLVGMFDQHLGGS